MHYGDTKAVDLRQIVTTDLVFGLPREGDINGSLSLVSCSAYNSVLFKLTSLLDGATVSLPHGGHPF